MSALKMLHFSKDYTCNDTGDALKGIPVVTFNGSFTNCAGDNVDMTYYWSYQNGQVYPVAAKMTGNFTLIIFKDIFTITIDFTDFIPDAPKDDHFFPPKDIYCQDRPATEPISKYISLPDYFSYSSERTMTYGDDTFAFYQQVGVDYRRSISSCFKRFCDWRFFP